jgi:ribosomal protein S18 acetylase RimI-like enzyme
MPTFPGPVEIKNVVTEDINDILDVYRQCEDFLALGPCPKASPAMVTKDIEDVYKEGGVFKSIYAGSRLIGVVSYVTKGFAGKLSDACMYLLMITPSFRKKGIGTRIVETIEKEIIADAKITAILAGVQVNNLGALKFWRNNGYRVTSGPELMPDGTTVFHLCKHLTHIM